MLRRLFTAAAAATASATSYQLFYSDAGNCDPPQQPDCKPSEPPAMNIKKATFSADGALQSNVNVTGLLNGVGYLSLHPSGSTIMYATEDTNFDGVVRTWSLDLTSPNAKPSILLNDATNLLAPCAPQCTDVNTFHATYTPDGKKIVFAYRVWDINGNAIGSQALAVCDTDGSNVVPLTFNTSGSEGGVGIMDTCPAPVPNDPSRVLFVRTVDEGETNLISIVDLKTGASDQLSQLPEWADASGCPNWLPTKDGLTTMVMLCKDCDWETMHKGEPVHRQNHAAAWGKLPKRILKRGQVKGGQDAADPIYYAVIKQNIGQDPTTFTYTKLFDVPIINSTDYDDTYGVTQCDAIHNTTLPGAWKPGQTGVISCQGADKDYDSFTALFVDIATGNSTVNNYETNLACMTPRCSLLTAVAN